MLDTNHAKIIDSKYYENLNISDNNKGDSPAKGHVHKVSIKRLIPDMVEDESKFAINVKNLPSNKNVNVRGSAKESVGSRVSVMEEHLAKK